MKTLPYFTRTMKHTSVETCTLSTLSAIPHQLWDDAEADLLNKCARWKEIRSHNKRLEIELWPATGTGWSLTRPPGTGNQRMEEGGKWARGWGFYILPTCEVILGKVIIIAVLNSGSLYTFALPPRYVSSALITQPQPDKTSHITASALIWFINEKQPQW